MKLSDAPSTIDPTALTPADLLTLAEDARSTYVVAMKCGLKKEAQRLEIAKALAARLGLAAPVPHGGGET